MLKSSSLLKPFLKWPGNKYRTLHNIVPHLPHATTLVEPFVGSGAVFLNTNYEKYKLADTNIDLISLYKILQEEGSHFIDYAARYFANNKHNNAHAYYKLRAKFNQIGPSREKAAIFLYLNRHGFNGLCRYNLKGLYNVPFGSYKKPYFPAEEMLIFHQKSQQATFMCCDFSECLKNLRSTATVYCDPPYVALSKTANFSSYFNSFSHAQQDELAQVARKLQLRNIKVVISNHDISYTRNLYKIAQIRSFYVRRSISCKGNARGNVRELLAIF